MKSLRPKWHLFQQKHVLFYSYRWLAWLYAVLVVLLTASSLEDTGRLLWLLVVMAALNVAATFMARPYVATAERRPWLLGLDILLGVALLSLSNGAWLAFMPYALASLVLPALLLPLRVALLSALIFVFLEQLARFSAGVPAYDSFADLGPLLLSVFLPLAFVLGGVALQRVLASGRSAGASLARPVQTVFFPDRESSPFAPRAGFQSFSPSTDARPATGSTRQGFETVVESYHSPVQRDLQSVGRAVCQVPPGASVDLPDALEQLVRSFRRHNDIEVRVCREGTSRPLGSAQYVLLVKLAQETLLNIQQHARAKSASLTLRYDPQTVMLIIQDDGVGLLDGTHELPGLHSLRALRYRLHEFDGQLQVVEGEDGGLTVRGLLPLN